LVIGILLAASGFTADILGEYLGPIEYKGYIVFDYPEGENPIINIVFTVDPTLAGNLIILNVPSPWSHSYGGGILALSGGSLGPGGSVRVTVSLNQYFEDGEYMVSSVGTTSADEVSTASGPLLVGELYLLNVLGMASANRFPLLALVAGFAFLELYLSRRKPKGIDGLAHELPVIDSVIPELTESSETPPSDQIDTDTPSIDSSDYDNSDLPGLNEIDESDTDPPLTDTSEDEGSYFKMYTHQGSFYFPMTPEDRERALAHARSEVIQFLSKYSIPEEIIEKLFLFEGGTIRPIYQITTTDKKKAQKQLTLLNALRNMLSGNDLYFNREEIRRLCIDHNVFDKSNFYRYYGENTSLFRSHGNLLGWNKVGEGSLDLIITIGGERELAETIREILEDELPALDPEDNGSVEPEGEGVLDRIVNFFRNLF
jgi:hypothetical protein